MAKSLLDRRIDQIKKEFGSYVREYGSKLPRSTSYNAVRSIFRQNVVEVIFKRRIKPGVDIPIQTGHAYEYRRMLCTANWDLIKNPKKNINARNDDYFKWKVPIHGKPEEYWAKRRIVVVWDLLKLKWRCVSLDEFTIISFFPLSDESDKEKLRNLIFGSFYRKFTRGMSDVNRLQFSDRINEKIDTARLNLPNPDSILIGEELSTEPFTNRPDAQRLAETLIDNGYENVWVFEATENEYYVVLDQ